ncbi:MAG: DUF1549 domain-containing protein [Pedosphaera sp.]|nr:DUF1549 domain-containing protein [Pedosphaera sp.]
MKLNVTSRLAALLLSAPLLAQAAPSLVEVRAYPPTINLTAKQDKQSLVVQAVYSDATTQDVTTKAEYAFADKKTAVMDKEFVVRPGADGQTALTVKFGGKTLSIPVKVEQAATEWPISFSLDVMPVFNKAGCNTGSCHGAARGKDGFRLSLFGYDPDGDYHRITRENLGRRINIALPDDSLMLEKAAGRVPHTGGERFTSASPLYQTIVKWLAAGAPKDPAAVAKVVGLEIHPTQSVLEGAGASQRLTVRAIYSDGSDRDVTDMASYMSANDLAAKISAAGVITADKRGESFVLARYEDFSVGSQVLVIPKSAMFEFPKVPENNYIDTLVNNKLKKIRITPSELCDDATYLRRITLDIVGKLPSVEEVQAFGADADPKKREKKIDELLERKEFTQMWVMKWAELLQIRTDNNRFQYKSALHYYDWLADQFAQNRPMNEMVQDLLNATGGTFANPEGNFYKVETDTLKLTENVAQIFMGMRIQCAQCHNHPFDRWTMNDYYGFASFFAQVGRKTGEDNRETVVFNRASGGVSHPVGNRDMKPKFLGGDLPEMKPGEDRRAALAKWLASPENPFFAKNLANIVWSHFLGKGIVDPVDDVRISNPPSNPELLDELGKRFAASGYNFRKLVRDICTSRTYQLTTKANAANAEDTRNFAKANIRRMRAEVLLDCINQVTAGREKFRGLPLGSSAVEIVDGRTSTFFLTTFGRATRDTVCSCEVQMEPNLSQALHLLNGETVNAKITAGGTVATALREKKSAPQIIDELYFRCLARKPTAKEQGELMEFFKEGRPELEVLNDIFWSLLNSKEFLFNH